MCCGGLNAVAEVFGGNSPSYALRVDFIKCMVLLKALQQISSH